MLLHLSVVNSSTFTGDRAYLFNRASHDITTHYDLLGLPETEGSTNCLLFDHRVPLRFENMYSRCTGEVQPKEELELPGLYYTTQNESIDFDSPDCARPNCHK